MKSKFFTILFILCSFKLFSQISRKPVIEVEWKSTFDKTDTSKFYVTKIDTIIFKEMLAQNSKLAIQFWQPWCNGIKDLIPNVNILNAKLKIENYHFILISDNPTEFDYYSIKDGKIGMILYYFNKYRIHFPTYIIGKGEELETYNMIIANYIQKKIKSHFFCFVLDNKALVYQNYTYNFYKKYLK